MNNNNKQPYLKKLKELDPEKLQSIREKALETRRAETLKLKSFRDLINDNLSIVIMLRDKNTGKIKTDNKGRPIQITKKELYVMNTIDNAITNGNIKELKEIADIIGELNHKQENNINLVFDSIRKELGDNDNE